VLLWIVYCAAVLEVGARLVFAWQAGKSALVYGTPFSRLEVSRKDKRWDETLKVKEHTTEDLDSEIGGYSKYYPRQKMQINVEAPGKPATLVLPAGVAFYSVTANNHGFRGPDFDQARTPGVARVITLGASSTYGYRNRDEETYPVYLQQYLNHALESRSCGEFRSFEVINFGIPHLSAVNIHALLVAEGLPLKPDVVTFYEGANETRRIQRNLPQRGLLWLSKYSVVALYLSTMWENQLETFTEADVRYHTAGRSEFFLKHLSAIRDECQQHGALFIVASQLARSVTLSRRYLADYTHAQEVERVQQKLASGERIVMSELLFLIHAEIMQSLEKWAKENDVPYVDVVHAFDEAHMRNQLLTWVHLTAKGNQLIAQELGDEILERFCTGQQAKAPAPAGG
jgi:lysophospholipase L1-like esterase